MLLLDHSFSTKYSACLSRLLRRASLAVLVQHVCFGGEGAIPPSRSGVGTWDKHVPTRSARSCKCKPKIPVPKSIAGLRETITECLLNKVLYQLSSIRTTDKSQEREAWCVHYVHRGYGTAGSASGVLFPPLFFVLFLWEKLRRIAVEEDTLLTPSTCTYHAQPPPT